MILKRLLPWLFAACALAASPVSAQTALTRADGASVRIKTYGPASGCGKTALLSHGYGGGVDRNSAMAQALAARGWRVIAVEHAESGGAGRLRDALFSGDMRAALMRAASDAGAHRARMADIDAALAFAASACRPRQLVLIGHSMGAATAMIEAGARARNGVSGRDRFDAYVALSPQGVGYMFAEGAWRGVAKPVLMVTGTRDGGADGGWETRLPAFEGLPPGRKRFAVLPGVNHMQMSGIPEGAGRVIAALIDEFAEGIRSGSLPRSRVEGVEVRDR